MKKSKVLTKPNNRERKVLTGLCLGNIEDEVHFSGVGPNTFTGMENKGSIEKAYDETYDVDGYKITAEGQKILNLSSG